MADARFDLALPIGIADATRQRDRPVVGEHVAIERIDRRVVDVGGEDALLQVVEHDDPHGPAELAEGPLMERGPHLRARPPDEKADGLAGVAEGQDEEPRAPVFARRRVTHHRPVPVIDLGFLAGGRRDDHTGLDGGAVPERRHEAPYAGIPRGEAVVIDQVLPDGHGVAPAAQRLDDQLAVGLARTRARRAARPRRVGGYLLPGGRFWVGGVGGHLRGNGRFCWTATGTAAGRAPQGQRLSSSRWPSRGAPLWSVRCVGATTRGAPAPESAVVCRQPRRCSCGAGTQGSPPSSTSRAAIGNGRFSAVH